MPLGFGSRILMLGPTLPSVGTGWDIDVTREITDIVQYIFWESALFLLIFFINELCSVLFVSWDFYF